MMNFIGQVYDIDKTSTGNSIINLNIVYIVNLLTKILLANIIIIGSFGFISSTDADSNIVTLSKTNFMEIIHTHCDWPVNRHQHKHYDKIWYRIWEIFLYVTIILAFYIKHFDNFSQTYSYQIEFLHSQE